MGKNQLLLLTLAPANYIIKCRLVGTNHLFRLIG